MRKHLFAKNTSVNILTYTVISCLLLFSFSGCGAKESSEIAQFTADMNTFYESIAEKNEQINALDPDDEASVDTLLSILDSLAEDFATLDAIEVPNEYYAVDQFASEGRTYMDEAVKLYHQALEGDENYQNILVAARENYKRANLRIQYINDILEGKEPEIETHYTTNSTE